MNILLTQKSVEGFGNDNARTACPILYRPTDEKYSEAIRKFQGCPTIAVTPKGRVFLGWYSGGIREPHIENYNILTYSDDGVNFKAPLLVIPSEESRGVHALDIQLWIAPNGALWVCWVQNNAMSGDDAAFEMLRGEAGQPSAFMDGWIFPDMRHTAWCVVCDDPDADDPVFSEPRNYDIGFLRCKPLALSNGRWIFFNYDQLTDRYGYSISDDEGKTFTRKYGAKKFTTHFDECMAYQRRDGSIRMLARANKIGKIPQSVSLDNGDSWEEAALSEIPNPSTRFFISRTPSGRVLLVNNHHSTERTNMTVYLSEDDGETWRYTKCIDNRPSLSYPDVDFFDGKIYLTYDRERMGAKEILLAVFTEADIIDPDKQIEISIISKP